MTFHRFSLIDELEKTSLVSEIDISLVEEPCGRGELGIYPSFNFPTSRAETRILDFGNWSRLSAELSRNDYC